MNQKLFEWIFRNVSVGDILSFEGKEEYLPSTRSVVLCQFRGTSEASPRAIPLGNGPKTYYVEYISQPVAWGDFVAYLRDTTNFELYLITYRVKDYAISPNPYEAYHNGNRIEVE